MIIFYELFIEMTVLRTGYCQSFIMRPNTIHLYNILSPHHLPFSVKLANLLGSFLLWLLWWKQTGCSVQIHVSVWFHLYLCCKAHDDTTELRKATLPSCITKRCSRSPYWPVFNTVHQITLILLPEVCGCKYSQWRTELCLRIYKTDLCMQHSYYKPDTDLHLRTLTKTHFLLLLL